MITMPQVLTSDTENFADALLMLFDAGHVVVNWNLGCPTRNVAGRGRGCGLMPHPRRIDEILTYVLHKTPVKLSVKIRLGYHDPDEHLAVLEVLNQHPLTEVVLHARTAGQTYLAAPDIDRAEAALALCRHPFIYNGDITDVSGFQSLRRRLPGAAGWMIGRGALTWPFLATQLKMDNGIALPKDGCQGQLRPDDARLLLREFHDLMFADYEHWLSGPRRLLDRMKAQWSYLVHCFVDSASIATRIGRCQDVPSYLQTVDWAFEHSLHST